MTTEIVDKVRLLMTTLWEAQRKPNARAWAIHVALTYAINMDPNVNKRDIWKSIQEEYEANLRISFPEQKDAAQSFRRTSGDAWEMFVEDYLNSNDVLRREGVRAVRLSGEDFNNLTVALDVEVRPKDIDFFLQGIDDQGSVRVFGALFPKASYAERIRADEVPSRALMAKGLWSATVTLDAREELGTEERPSVKRKTINQGAFHGCYSFNEHTASGPRIHIVRCTDRSKNNPLVRDILAAWKEKKQD